MRCFGVTHFKIFGLKKEKILSYTWLTIKVALGTGKQIIAVSSVCTNVQCPIVKQYNWIRYMRYYKCLFYLRDATGSLCNRTTLISSINQVSSYANLMLTKRCCPNCCCNNLFTNLINQLFQTDVNKTAQIKSIRHRDSHFSRPVLRDALGDWSTNGKFTKTSVVTPLNPGSLCKTSGKAK